MKEAFAFITCLLLCILCCVGALCSAAVLAASFFAIPWWCAPLGLLGVYLFGMTAFIAPPKIFEWGTQ